MLHLGVCSRAALFFLCECLAVIHMKLFRETLANPVVTSHGIDLVVKYIAEMAGCLISGHAPKSYVAVDLLGDFTSAAGAKRALLVENNSSAGKSQSGTVFCLRSSRGTRESKPN